MTFSPLLHLFRVVLLQLLRVSVGLKAGWRWTKQFGVNREGLQCVELCTADRELASLYVKVERSGGCQLMVGVWVGGACGLVGGWGWCDLCPSCTRPHTVQHV